MSTKNVRFLRAGKAKHNFPNAHFCKAPLHVRLKMPTTLQLVRKKQNFTWLQQSPWARSQQNMDMEKAKGKLPNIQLSCQHGSLSVSQQPVGFQQDRI